MRSILFSMFCFVCPCLLFGQKSISVILIGGQSNAIGRGYVCNIPRGFETDTTVKLYHSDALCREGGAFEWKPLHHASEIKEKFGVELSLGTALKKGWKTREIALIKHGLSGSNLYNQWNPGNNGRIKGNEYKKFIVTVEKGLAELRKEGYTPKIEAMVWQQGEGDAREMEHSRAYAENLNNLIKTIRNHFDEPSMLFVYGEVLPLVVERFIGRTLVRQSQRDVATDGNTKWSLPYTYLVEGDDLQMSCDDYRTPTPNDDVHLGTYGILTLGERFAKVILKMQSINLK